MKKVMTFILSLALLFAIIYSPDIMNNNASGSLEVHYIDVGQGDSILVKNDGENMLIDGGSRSKSEDLINYLKEQDVEKIKYIIGTHPHEDHIGGLIEVINNFEVENIMLPNALSNTIVFEDLLDAIDRQALKIKKPIVSDDFNIGKSKVTILAPNSEKYSLTNNYSIVLKLQNGENSFVFTGDAEKNSENEMLANNKLDLKADVLKLGHHGSNTSSNEEFLYAVDPKYAIISVGYKNSYRHPDAEILEILDKKDIESYRTDIHGTIIAKSDGKDISFNNKSIGFESKEIYVKIAGKLKDLKDSFFIKYITVKTNPENM